MNRTQAVFTSFIFIVLFGCAATWPWPYHEYVPDLKVTVKDSVLRAKLASNDVPLSVCQGTEQVEDPCYVFTRAEYIALVKERNDLKTRLSACEASK
jgi:hypothetical protein